MMNRGVHWILGFVSHLTTKSNVGVRASHPFDTGRFTCSTAGCGDPRPVKVQCSHDAMLTFASK